MDNIYYVGVKEPAELHRKILESQMSFSGMIKKLESIKQIRTQKLANIIEIKKIVKELDIILNRLKGALPKKARHPINDLTQLEKQFDNLASELQAFV